MGDVSFPTAASLGLGVHGTTIECGHTHPHLLSRPPHRPHIVGVFELVAGDLLLVAGAPPIGVLERVEKGVGVEPTGEIRGTKGQPCPIP